VIRLRNLEPDPIKGGGMPEAEDSLDLTFLSEDYFRAGGRVEFVRFSSRFAALVWLHRSLSRALADRVGRLRALKASGRHGDPEYWGHDSQDSFDFSAGEYDLVLDESFGVLQDATPMCGGVVILSGTAALESLMTDLLDQPQDGLLHKAGLRRKVAELSCRWAAYIDGDTLRGNVDWLAERRNGFAHDLIDGEGPWPRYLAPGRFGTDEVEEAFQRIGKVASLLQIGWECYLTAQRR